jgi:hypothetical protein
MEKKSLIGAAAAKQKTDRKTPQSKAADAAVPARPAESRKLAVAKLATAKLSTARLVTLKKLGG